jgi:ABC-type nitrate/sulfonate/bicarbonate transport system substrate-binding protein
MLNGKLRMAPTCYHTLHLMPVVAAHEMNFFYDVGLRDEYGQPAYDISRDSMVPFGLERQGIVQAMKEKAVDIALDVQTRSIFIQRSRGADIYIIAGWRNQHIHVWVGAPGIDSLADLKGKPIGISDFGSNKHWAISLWLKKYGLDPERDVEMVRGIFHPVHITALRSGRVACAPVTTWEAKELEQEGFKALITLQQQYPNGRPERIIAATGRILEEKPEWVKSFLKGMIRSYWLIRDQPKNFDYVSRLERRLRNASADPEERGVKLTCDDPRRAAEMPFPMDGLPTGFEDMLREEEAAGDLDYDVPEISAVCALDLVKDAFAELMADKVTRAEYERVLPVAEQHGY